MAHILRYFEPPPDPSEIRLLLHRSTTSEREKIFQGQSKRKGLRPHDIQRQNIARKRSQNRVYAPCVQEIEKASTDSNPIQRNSKIPRDSFTGSESQPNDSSLVHRAQEIVSGKGKSSFFEASCSKDFDSRQDRTLSLRNDMHRTRTEPGRPDYLEDAMEGVEVKVQQSLIEGLEGVEATPEKLVTRVQCSSSLIQRLMIKDLDQMDRLWAEYNSHSIFIGLIFSSHSRDQFSSTCRKFSPAQRKYLLKQRRLSPADPICEKDQRVAPDDVETIHVAALAFCFASPSTGISETFLIPKEETGLSFCQLVESLFHKCHVIVCFNLQLCAHHLLKSDVSVDFTNKNMTDPKILAWLLQPELESYELGALVSAFEPKAMRNHPMKTCQANPLDRMGADLKSVFVLQHSLERQLRPELENPIRTETQLSVLLAELEHRGVGIDLEYLRSKKERLMDHMNHLTSESERSLGHAINLASPQQVSKAMYEDLKLPRGIIKSNGVSRKREAKGYSTTNEATLAELSKLHPFPALVLQFRHILKTKSTWIDGLVDKAIRDKHGLPRVHANWNATNTATGRLSSSDPNLQNIPRSALQLSTSNSVDTTTNDLNLVVRDAFVSRDGHTLVAADYSQVELRISAHVSGDANLIKILRSAGTRGDTFRLIASDFLEKPIDTVSDEERQLVKRVCYGIMYGQGKQALGQALSAGPDQAAHMMQSFLDHFPSLKAFVQSAKAKARLHGCVRTLWGRTRPLPGIQSTNPELKAQAERQAVNSLIQGSAADIMKFAMLETQKLQQESSEGSISMLMEIHDELVFEVPDPWVSSFSKRVQSTMENVVTLAVPLLVNVKVGKRWGSLTTIETRDT